MRDPYLQDADVTLYHGDVLDVLRELEPESVDCVVTSPPYWGLRDYGQEGQLGLEPTPEEYVTRMVEVFREVRRVLAAHGTVWVNLGDSYNAYNGNRGLSGSTLEGTDRPDARPRLPSGHGLSAGGLKPKDLVGIPWRVAFALQADGWYLRSDIIWSKPNPMPESVTDRPTKAHEYLFLLSKQPRYFFDQEAVRERYGDPAKGPDGRRKTGVFAGDGSIQHRDGERWPNLTGRNIRSVWEIATQPYPEAHFATFPEELARRCIAAGCPEQVCRVCGKARERMVDVTYELNRRTGGVNATPRAGTAKDGPIIGTYGMTQKKDKIVETLGFTDCGHSDYRPGIVLDPFVGSGTTCHVARKLGRRSVGIDLSSDYLDLADRRLQQQSLLTEGVA